MEPVEYEFDGINYRSEPIGRDNLSFHDLHVKRVYGDPEFIDELKELEDLHGDNINNTVGKTGSTRSAEVYSYFEQLAEDWHITLGEVSLAYNNAHFGGKRLMRKPGEQPMLIDWSALLNENHFTVEFNLTNLKKDHLEDLWKQIEQRQLQLNGGILKRNRAPENTELLYAIFKARKAGDTYEEIARDYDNGTLEGYKGGNSQFNGADSIGHYYRRYMT